MYFIFTTIVIPEFLLLLPNQSNTHIKKKTSFDYGDLKKVQKSWHNSIMSSMYPSALSAMIDTWPILFHLCPTFVSYRRPSSFKAKAQTQHLFIPGKQAFWTPLCSGLCTGGHYEGLKKKRCAQITVRKQREDSEEQLGVWEDWKQTLITREQGCLEGK